MKRLRSRLGYAREVAHVLAAGLLVESLVRFEPLPSLCRRFGVRLATADDPLSPPSGVLPPWTERRLRAVGAVFRFWPWGRQGDCLRRGLVTGHRLRTIDPVLRFGVRRANGAVLAHAWIEVHGVALQLDPRYTPMMNAQRRP